MVEQQAAGELLVVDDDEVSRYVLRGLLSETRFRVVETSSGVEALELARERRPSAIFLDLMMPGKSGFEVLNDLKLDAKTRNIPIVVHTAKMLSTDERDRLADQTIAIIPKTHIDRQASLKMIREALARAGVGALNPQEVANDGI